MSTSRNAMHIILLLFATNLFAFSDPTNYYDQEPPLYFPELFAEDMFNGTVYTISYSPDGTEMYYSGYLNSSGYNDGYTIFYKKFSNGKWSEEKTALFCTPGDAIQDASPCFSPDGNRLYFCSNRAGGLGDFDLWYVERSTEGWGDPVNAGNMVNSSGREDYPYVAENGTLFFNSAREGTNGFTDVFYSKNIDGVFQKAIQLADSVNTSDWDENPAVIGNKLFTGVHNKQHFAVSYAMENDKWSVPEIVSGGMFSKGYFDGFRLTPDGKYFMYTKDSTASGSNFETYWVDAEVLDYLGVREAPFNYVASWYTGKKEQMAIALHPKLAKRQITSEDNVSSVSYSWMLDATESCYGCRDNVKSAKKEISILHESESIATAKLLSEDFYDYLQLVKFDNNWKVLNVAWDYYSITAEGDSESLIKVLETYTGGYNNSDSTQYANIFHKSYAGRRAVSHEDVHSVNKLQFLTLQANCSSYNFNNDFSYEILDLYKNIASVKISKGDSLEYLHVTFQKGQWYIINALRNFNFDPERNFNLDTPIKLTKNGIEEMQPVGTEIGKMYLDVPKENSITFHLDATAENNNNNDLFYIEDDILKSNKIFNSEDSSTFIVSIIAVINSEDTIHKSFTIIKKDYTPTEIKKNKNLILYPNPSGGMVTVCMNEIKNAISIHITDMNGKTITEKKGPFGNIVEFDLSNLSKGSYSVSIICADSIVQNNIVLK